MAPEFDWKLNHLPGTDRSRPTVNHLIQDGQVTIGVCDPAVGCARRSHTFRNSGANDGGCDPEETRQARHGVPWTRSVTHAVRLTVPVEITTVRRHKVHHLVVPDGTRIRRFAPVRQTLVILEDTLRYSVAICERQTPRLVSSHVAGNILVDGFLIVQTERIIVAIVVVTPHRTPGVPLKEGCICNRLFLGQGR